MTSRCRVSSPQGAYSEHDKGTDGLYEGFDSHDVDHALQIVGEYMQTHLGTDMLESPGQEVI